MNYEVEIRWTDGSGYEWVTVTTDPSKIWDEGIFFCFQNEVEMQTYTKEYQGNEFVITDGI